MKFKEYLTEAKHSDFGKGESKKYQDSPFSCGVCKNFSNDKCPREKAGFSNDSQSTICKDFKK